LRNSIARLTDAGIVEIEDFGTFFWSPTISTIVTGLAGPATQFEVCPGGKCMTLEDWVAAGAK
jgi:hypothetical protein